MDIAWVEVWQRVGICKRIYGSHFLYWERIFCKLKLFSIFTCCQWNKEWAINGPVLSVSQTIYWREISRILWQNIYISHYKVTSLFHKDTRDCRCWNLEQKTKYWGNSVGQAASGMKDSQHFRSGPFIRVWRCCRTCWVPLEFLLHFLDPPPNPPHCFTVDYSAINLNIGHYILNISHTDDFRISWK